MAVSTVGRRHDPMHEQTGYQQRGVLNYYYFSVVVLSLLLFHFNISQCYGFMAANIKCGSQIKSESFRMQLSNDKRSAFEHTNNPIDDDGEEDDEEADDDDISLDGEIGCSRRRAGIILSSSLAAPLLVGCTRAPVASASVEEETATAAGAATIAESVVNYDCLRDLPPIPRDSVRIYLCRHGQTENNRLRKVQGARVDPPINDNGTRQATNLGIALSRVNNPSPEIVVHSTLLRAKMTAEIAAKQINHDSVYATTKELHFLREVDFGPVAEGQPVALAKAGMKLTYGAWALGNIDYRPKLGGDSGREIFNRAAEALKSLANEAQKSNGCVAAVSHSTYLRMLLALVLDESLLDTAARDINNGSITVIDIKRDFGTRSKNKIITMKSKIFSGPAGVLQKRSPEEEEFKLELPICNVVRINEVRHLPAL